MRWWVSVCIVFLVVFTSSAQTETPTPTATATLTPAPYVFATIAPIDGTPPGQLTRFDYVSTAGALIVFQTVMFVFIDAAQFIWDAFND